MSAARTKSRTRGTEFARADRAAKFILAKTRLRPKIALVLGSGLGAFADEFSAATRIPYEKIPGFPPSTAIGHAGRLVIGKVGNVAVAAMQGRVHFYEGYTAQEVAFPMRVLGRMGIRSAILTNAAGGINLQYTQGALVVISDHINLQGINPLIGPNDERFGPRFPDMTQAYWKPYREIGACRSQNARYQRARRRVRGTRWPQLRNSCRNSLFAYDWSRFGGNVHRSGDHRGAAHGDSGAGNFLRHQHGRGDSRSGRSTTRKYWKPASE